jgi:hypothetical protein
MKAMITGHLALSGRAFHPCVVATPASRLDEAVTAPVPDPPRVIVTASVGMSTYVVCDRVVHTPVAVLCDDTINRYQPGGCPVTVK